MWRAIIHSNAYKRGSFPETCACIKLSSEYGMQQLKHIKLGSPNFTYCDVVYCASQFGSAVNLITILRCNYSFFSSSGCDALAQASCKHLRADNENQAVQSKSLQSCQFVAFARSLTKLMLLLHSQLNGCTIACLNNRFSGSGIKIKLISLHLQVKNRVPTCTRTIGHYTLCGTEQVGPIGKFSG
jgi:hypothetical protein